MVADEDYADAIATYSALGVGRLANRCSSQCFWDPAVKGSCRSLRAKHCPWCGLRRSNPFSDSSGNFIGQMDYLVEALARTPARGCAEVVQQLDAAAHVAGSSMLVATDPPYYNNVPYADLSDFFYVWLRRCLEPDLP